MCDCRGARYGLFGFGMLLVPAQQQDMADQSLRDRATCTGVPAAAGFCCIHAVEVSSRFGIVHWQQLWGSPGSSQPGALPFSQWLLLVRGSRATRH